MRNSSSFLDDKYKIISLFVLALILLGFSFMGRFDFARKLVDFFYSPEVYLAITSANSIEEGFSTFSDVAKIREDNIDLIVENSRLKGENETVLLLAEENSRLKQQIKLGSKKKEYVEANVVRSSSLGAETIIVNVGSKSGVKEGDIALIGNVLVGIVGEVELNSSSVILPTNRKLSLEGFVITQDNKEKNLDQLSTIFQRSIPTINGVISGSAGSIQIQNIATDQKVQVGDTVMSNDSRLGGIYFIGNISTISDGISEITKKGSVQPFYNYEELNYLFIEIK